MFPVVGTFKRAKKAIDNLKDVPDPSVQDRSVQIAVIVELYFLIGAMMKKTLAGMITYLVFELVVAVGLHFGIESIISSPEMKKADEAGIEFEWQPDWLLSLKKGRLSTAYP